MKYLVIPETGACPRASYHATCNTVQVLVCWNCTSGERNGAKGEQS